jgi:hypothetical protein
MPLFRELGRPTVSYAAATCRLPWLVVPLGGDGETVVQALSRAAAFTPKLPVRSRCFNPKWPETEIHGGTAIIVMVGRAGHGRRSEGISARAATKVGNVAGNPCKLTFLAYGRMNIVM